MLSCLIFPWARALRNGQENPKNYPHWTAVIHQLRARGYFVSQVSQPGEIELPVDEKLFGLRTAEVISKLKEANLFISIDSFAPHLAWYHKIYGIVIFGKSDPLIFGYPENTNLLKDRSYLRKDQFEIWEAEKYDSRAFVGADVVVEAVERRCKEDRNKV